MLNIICILVCLVKVRRGRGGGVGGVVIEVKYLGLEKKFWILVFFKISSF